MNLYLNLLHRRSDDTQYPAWTLHSTDHGRTGGGGWVARPRAGDALAPLGNPLRRLSGLSPHGLVHHAEEGGQGVLSTLRGVRGVDQVEGSTLPILRLPPGAGAAAGNSGSGRGGAGTTLR